MSRLFCLILSIWIINVTTENTRSVAGDLSLAINVLWDNCLGCHDSPTSEGGVDLTTLQPTNEANTSSSDWSESQKRLWGKVERVVRRGQMPPEDQGPLQPTEKQSILTAYFDTFVLRDGKPHIGPTPLRRLTRYELDNTLRDLLWPNHQSSQATASPLVGTSLVEQVPTDLPGKSGFDNDATRMQGLRPPLREIAEAVHLAVNPLATDPERFKSVFSQTLSGDSNEANAETVPLADAETIRSLLQMFISNACRCDQHRASDLAGIYLDQFQRLENQQGTETDRFLRVIEMILVSPDFLYRVEHSRDQTVPYPVTGIELATRLSYFLWGTMPDASLRKAGVTGELLNQATLLAEVKRMLDSPMRLSLADNFASQWLGYNELIDNRQYLVDEAWNRQSYEEVFFFMDEMVRSDRSILDLIDSEWGFLRQAKVQDPGNTYQLVDPAVFSAIHADVDRSRYLKKKLGSANTSPPVLVKMTLAGHGGILTSPAVMRITASKNRTSPIRRGVWVLETLIGREMEPPADIPPLEEAMEQLVTINNPTVAQILKQHVSRSECVSCHKSIDPLGLGLENFSPLGEWRIEYPDRKPIESGGMMPNGERFANPAEFKRLILGLYGDEIAENFVAKLFAYAIGRPLEPYDRASLDRVMGVVRKKGYRVTTAIEQIVLTPQFRFRQDD